jgi:hypothetical protein
VIFQGEAVPVLTGDSADAETSASHTFSWRGWRGTIRLTRRGMLKGYVRSSPARLRLHLLELGSKLTPNGQLALISHTLSLANRDLLDAAQTMGDLEGKTQDQISALESNLMSRLEEDGRRLQQQFAEQRQEIITGFKQFNTDLLKKIEAKGLAGAELKNAQAAVTLYSTMVRFADPTAADQIQALGRLVLAIGGLSQAQSLAAATSASVGLGPYAAIAVAAARRPPAARGLT